MQIRTVQRNGVSVAILQADELLITDPQSVLDVLATVRHETGSDRMVLPMAVVSEDFFNLRSGLAGEALQKLINYRMKLAIVGDFSVYTSKALRDLIRESNRGHDAFFVATEEEAIQKLSKA